MLYWGISSVSNLYHIETVNHNSILCSVSNLYHIETVNHNSILCSVSNLYHIETVNYHSILCILFCNTIFLYDPFHPIKYDVILCMV